ncbi:MAG TPA: hypothetical protein VJX67_21580 [Blastocatellia bacterium]|nr:hypothetical protein [Blastocatellia bacterium]
MEFAAVNFYVTLSIFAVGLICLLVLWGFYSPARPSTQYGFSCWLIWWLSLVIGYWLINSAVPWKQPLVLWVLDVGSLALIAFSVIYCRGDEAVRRKPPQSYIESRAGADGGTDTPPEPHGDRSGQMQDLPHSAANEATAPTPQPLAIEGGEQPEAGAGRWGLTTIAASSLSVALVALAVYYVFLSSLTRTSPVIVSIWRLSPSAVLSNLAMVMFGWAMFVRWGLKALPLLLGALAYALAQIPAYILLFLLIPQGWVQPESAALLFHFLALGKIFIGSYSLILFLSPSGNSPDTAKPKYWPRPAESIHLHPVLRTTMLWILTPAYGTLVGLLVLSGFNTYLTKPSAVTVPSPVQSQAGGPSELHDKIEKVFDEYYARVLVNTPESHQAAWDLFTDTRKEELNREKGWKNGEDLAQGYRTTKGYEWAQLKMAGTDEGQGSVKAEEVLIAVDEFPISPARALMKQPAIEVLRDDVFHSLQEKIVSSMEEHYEIGSQELDRVRRVVLPRLSVESLGEPGLLEDVAEQATGERGRLLRLRDLDSTTDPAGGREQVRSVWVNERTFDLFGGEWRLGPSRNLAVGFFH